MLSKKSPREGCGIGKRNNRIEKSGSENQRCALAPDLESILRGRMRKFLFRQHRSFASLRRAARLRGMSAVPPTAVESVRRSAPLLRADFVAKVVDDLREE